ncbi:MAG: hypothetical protein RXO24_06700, partial [Acidilobus sp.]
VYECPIHGENGDIKPVKVPYAFKLLLQEIMSMGIKPKIEVVDKMALVSRVSPLSLSKLSGAANKDDNSKGDSGNGSEDRR